MKWLIWLVHQILIVFTPVLHKLQELIKGYYAVLFFFLMETFRGFLLLNMILLLSHFSLRTFEEQLSFVQKHQSSIWLICCTLNKSSQMVLFCGFMIWGISFLLKVVEHSFRTRFCWCNSARAQGLQKTNMLLIERSFYLLNTYLHYLCYFSL